MVIFRHSLAYPGLIEECPGGQLLQDANLGEDVQVVEFDRFFVVAEGVARGRLCQILSARILREDLMSSGR
jgi:hypothetical protein